MRRGGPPVLLAIRLSLFYWLTMVGVDISLLYDLSRFHIFKDNSSTVRQHHILLPFFPIMSGKR